MRAALGMDTERGVSLPLDAVVQTRVEYVPPVSRSLIRELQHIEQALEKNDAKKIKRIIDAIFGIKQAEEEDQNEETQKGEPAIQRVAPERILGITQRLEQLYRNRKEQAERKRQAAALGDLSENFDYQDAQRQIELIDAEIAEKSRALAEELAGLEFIQGLTPEAFRNRMNSVLEQLYQSGLIEQTVREQVERLQKARIFTSAILKSVYN
ncbi:MAG: hypothetical protein N2045_14415, partial [Fimbriimonadales bacterium]|nr:hypothetical protein [Fimbriimonadales bacterium]